MELDPLHSQAALALKRQGIRKKPKISAAYSRWQEDGRGEAARITRHRADLSLDVPVLCRFNLKVSGHQWWELPKRWGGEARARGFSLEASGPLTPYLSGGLGWTHKDYLEDYLADKDSGHGHVWLRLTDYIRLGVGWQREDVVKNAFSLVQGVQADSWWLGAAADITRNLEAKAYARRLDFSDGNTGNWESLSIGYAVTDHPKILKFTLNLDYRETENQTVEITRATNSST